MDNLNHSNFQRLSTNYLRLLFDACNLNNSFSDLEDVMQRSIITPYTIIENIHPESLIKYIQLTHEHGGQGCWPLCCRKLHVQFLTPQKRTY